MAIKVKIGHVSCILLLLAVLSACRARSADYIKASVLTLNVAKVVSHSGAAITVNVSSGIPIRLWGEGNSWGYAHWRVIRIKSGKVDTFYQSPFQMFPRNIPDFKTIGQGAMVERTLDLNDGNWCWLDACSAEDERGIHGKIITFEPGDLIVVVYDVPLTDKALEFHVWNGVAAASITVR